MNTIVEHINSAGFSFVEFALPMLIQSSVLIAILLLADVLLRKKVKAVFRYWIWMLVLVKLVLPASLSSPLSLGYLFGDKLTYQDLAETTSALELGERAPADTLPGINPLYIQPNAFIQPTKPVTPNVESVISEPASPTAVPVTPMSWQGVVFLVWLAVVIAMGLLLLQRALFVRGLVAQAKKAGRLMNDELAYCCAGMRIKGKVALKVSPNATTPSVCGLIRPVILVPWNLVSTLGASRLRTVLMHELAHIKRGDLWVNLAQTALQIIYFYNPLLWLANCVIRRIREQAVDEAVLVAMGEKARQYPQTLVDVAKLAFKRPALSLRLIGVVESESALAGRIKHILGRPMPKSARLGIISVLAILIAGAILLPMARAEKNQKLLRGIDEKLKVTDKAGELTINSLYMPSPNGKDIIGANKVTMYVDVTNNSEKDIYLGLEYYTDSGTIAKVFSPGASSLAQIKRVPANWQGKLEYPIRYRRFAKGGYISITLARCAGKQIMKEKRRAVLPPEVEVIYEKKYNIVPIDDTQPDAGVLTDSSFTATLPNGVTVELVGVCEHPSEGKQWWLPDGSLLGQSPVRNIDVGGYNIRRGEAAYELVAKLTGPETLLSRSSTPEKWRIPQALKVGPGKSGKAKDKNGVPCLRATTAIVKNGLEKIDIEFGLAGIWEKRLTISSNESSKQKIRDTGVVINPPYEKDSNATVTIKIPNKIDSKMAINISAVLKNGKVRDSASWSRNSKIRFMRSTDNYEFHGVNLSDVDHFEIYTTKYQWVEFKNVSLKPNFKTDVQVSAQELVAKIIESERKIEDIQLHMTCTIPARNLVFYEYDWGYDGGKEFYTGFRNSTEPGRNEISRTTQITRAFDGQNEWSLRVSSEDKQPRGAIFKPSFSNFRSTMTFNTTLLAFDAKERSRLSFGEAIAQAESISVRDKVEFIDGHPCYVIEAVNLETDPSVNWAYDVRAWIDYQRNYRLLKFEKCRSISGKNRFKVVSRRVDNIKLKQIEGIWLPVEGRRTTFSTNDNGPPRGMSLARFASLSAEEQDRVGVFKLTPMGPPRRLEVDVKSIRLNKGIPPERFTIAFPDGCEVYNEFTGKRYVVGQPSEREAALSDAEWIERMAGLSVSELMVILRNSSVGKNKKKWFAAVHRLVEIGSAAVPELVAEIRRTEKPQTQSKLALTLRAIGDPKAVPGLIDGLGRSGFSSDYGIGEPRTELDMFIQQHQMDPTKKDLGLGRPVREITIALEKLTGHTEGHEHFHAYDLKYDRLGSYTVTPEIRDRQRQHRRQVAERWRKWWQANKDNIKPTETLPKPPAEPKPARSEKLEKLIMAAPEGSILTLAIVPNVDGSGRRPSLTKEEYQRYLNDLAQNGPFAGSIRGDSFQWSPVKGNPARFRDLPLSAYKERTYLLLCARAQYVMMPELEGKLAWGLEKVEATSKNGTPAIDIWFDEKAAELLGKLTKANINNHLAVAVDGWVLMAPAVRAQIRKVATITGDFTEEQVRTFVEDLRKGMAPADRQTVKGKRLIAEAADKLNKHDVAKMGPRRVVENFLIAGLAGLNEKLVWFVRPGSAVDKILDGTDLSEELLDGYKIKVVNVYAGSRDAFAVTSDITDQYGERLGKFMFYLSNENGNWLIYDLDAGEADRVHENLTEFLSTHPDVHVEVDDANPGFKALHITSHNDSLRIESSDAQSPIVLENGKVSRVSSNRSERFQATRLQLKLNPVTIELDGPRNRVRASGLGCNAEITPQNGLIEVKWSDGNQTKIQKGGSLKILLPDFQITIYDKAGRRQSSLKPRQSNRLVSGEAVQTDVQLADMKERIARGPKQVQAIDKALRGWFDGCVTGDVSLMKEAYPSPDHPMIEDHLHDMKELLGLNPGWQFSLLAAMWDKEKAMAVSGALEHGDPKVGGPMVLVWTFNNSEDKWGIIDIDLEELEGLQIENSRFMQKHPNAQVWFDNPDLNAPKMRQKTDVRFEEPEVGPVPIVQAVQNKATLPNGVTVELVGVCEHPSEGKQWWRADGSLLQEKPYGTIKGDRVFFGTNERAYEFVVRVAGPTDVGLKWKAVPDGGSRMTSFPHGSDGRLLPDLRVLITKFHKRTDRALVRIGVAPKVPDKDVTQDYEWVEFKDVSLRPGVKTDVQVEGESRVSKLLTALQNEKYVYIREPIIQMVEEIGNKEPISFLTEQLNSENRTRRCHAALCLELLGDKRGVPTIIKELNDTSHRPTTMIDSGGGEYQEGQVRQDHYYAAVLLGILGDERAVPALIEAIKDDSIDWCVAQSLGQIGDKRAVPVLHDMLDKNINKPFQRLYAGYGLAMLADEEGLKVVIDTLNNQQVQWSIRRYAIDLLGKLADKQAVPHLIIALKDDHPNIRVSAARALGAIEDASALPALEEALKDNTETKVNAPTTVSKAAAEAITQIKAGDGRKTDVQVEGEPAKLSAVTDLPNSQAEPQGNADQMKYEGRTIDEWMAQWDTRVSDDIDAATNALIRIGRPAVTVMIEEIKKRSNHGWRAVGVLSKMGPEAEDALELLIETALDKDLRFGDGRQSPTAYRGSVLYSLSRMTWARQRVITVLQRIAEDGEEEAGVRQQVIWVLRRVGKGAMPILQKLTEAEERSVRDAAHGAIGQLLEKEEGLSKDDYYTPLIEKDPFGPSVLQYLGNTKGMVNYVRPHPLTQKIKKLYRERLAKEPDAQLAWRLATIIQKGLQNTELMWAAPTDGSKGRSPREDPTENYTTLAEVLQLGFDHAESGSQLQRQFGTSLAKLRLLQGDWNRMNAMLQKLGQEPIQKESRQLLHAPPVDWQEDLRSQWKIADESMRSGNCSLEFKIEKAGKGLKGVHVLVKRAPEPTNVINTGISVDTLFFAPAPMKVTFGSFGYKARDRPMTRYAVSDESGIVRFGKLPNIPIKIEVLVPTSNFPEAASNWDLWMEVEPGKFKIAKKYGAGAINTQVPPAVVELKEGQTVHYPDLVVRPAFSLNVKDWDRVDKDSFTLSWQGLAASMQTQNTEYELEMYLSAPGSPQYQATNAPVVRSAKQLTKDTQWPVSAQGVGNLNIQPGNIYMFEVRAIDASGTIIARWPRTRVWVPWAYRQSNPPFTGHDTYANSPVHHGLWHSGSFGYGDGRKETLREKVARFLRDYPNAFEYEYVRMGKAWLDWRDGDREGARRRLEKLIKELPKGNVARGTAIWLIQQIDENKDPPKRLNFVPDRETSRSKAVSLPDEKTDVQVEGGQSGKTSQPKPAKPTAQEDSEHAGRISGVVVNSVTGQPIAGAYVGVGDFGDSGGSNYSRHRSQGFHDKTKTDEKGRFELGGLVFTDKHRYLKYHPLVVTHPDFVRYDEKIELLKDKPVPDVKVSIRPAAKIDVTVVDAQGNPLKGHWLIRLEALDGRRFIPPGSDPHLSSFASNIWAHWPDMRRDLGASEGFAFTELDTGRYSIEAIRFHLVDNPTPQNIWKPTITYHGSISSLEIQAGQAKQVQIPPQDHQTRLTVIPPEFPEMLLDKLKRSSRMPLMCLISRSPELLLWDDVKIYHLEDQRLGRIDKKRFFRGFFLQDKPLTINNLPPGSYSLFAMAVYGEVAGCLIGARADLAKGDNVTLDIPWRQPQGPSTVGPNRAFDYPVKLEDRDYSASELCEILTAMTESNPRIIADSSIENEKLRFGKGEMSVWDVLEMLYLDKGWKVDEGEEKTLIIRPADKTDAQVEGEYDNSLYQKQGAIRYALEFIGTPEESIDTTFISKHGQLANPRQLEFANKLFSLRKSKDVDMFISLLSDGTKKQLNDDNNKRMVHHHIRKIKDGTFLCGEYDFKFFATFREFTEKDSDTLKKHVSFAETPSHVIHYWHFHKPNYMLTGGTYYLIEDEGSYKIVPETLLHGEITRAAKKQKPSGPKEYGIVAFKQTDNAYAQPAVWKYHWNIELSPDVSENNTFQILKTTKVVSGQADLHPEIAAQKIIDESMIQKYKYDILKCRFYVGNSEPRYNYHQYGRQLSGWHCGLSIANTSKSTPMLFPGKDVTNVKPNKKGNFIGSDLQLLSFETSEGNIRYEHKVILRKDDSPEAKSAALLRLEQMTRRRISNNKLQYLDRILTTYANDHNSEYPDRLEQIKSYDTDEWLDWLLENIEYLGKGKTLTETSETVIAYDKTLLERAGSTNVLFNDGPVQYCNPNWLKKLGITGNQKTDVPVDVEEAREKVSRFIGADLPASVQNVKFHSGSFAESSRTLIRFDIPLSDLKNLLTKSDKLPDFPDLHENPKIQKDMDEVFKDFNIEWWKSDELESPVCAAWIKSERAKGAPKVWVVNILNICCSQVENNLMRVYISLYSHAPHGIPLINPDMEREIEDPQVWSKELAGALFGAVRANDNKTLKALIVDKGLLSALQGYRRNFDCSGFNKMVHYQKADRCFVIVSPIRHKDGKGPGREIRFGFKLEQRAWKAYSMGTGSIGTYVDFLNKEGFNVFSEVEIKREFPATSPLKPANNSTVQVEVEQGNESSESKNTEHYDKIPSDSVVVRVVDTKGRIIPIKDVPYTRIYYRDATTGNPVGWQIDLQIEKALSDGSILVNHRDVLVRKFLGMNRETKRNDYTISMCFQPEEGPVFSATMLYPKKATETLSFVVPPRTKVAGVGNVAPDELAGRVVDVDGNPIAGAIISVYPDRGLENHPFKTDSKGAFRMPGFGDRWCLYVKVEKDGYATQWLTDFEIGKNFIVTIDQSTVLQGVFVNDNGERAGRTQITLAKYKLTMQPRRGNSVGPITTTHETDHKGSYDFPVEPGLYDVKVASESGLFNRSRVFIGAGQIVSLPSTLKPGIRFKVRVVDSLTNKPIEDVNLWIDSHTTGRVDMKEGSQRTTNSKGLAIWESLMPGRTSFSIMKKGYCRWWSDARLRRFGTFKSVIYPGGYNWQRNIDSLRFDLIADMPVFVIKMEKGVKLSGRVLSPEGKPIAKAWVDITPADGPHTLTGDSRYRMITDENGCFGIEEKYWRGYVPAGKQVLYNVCAHDPEGRWANAVSKPFASKPADEFEFNLKMTKGGSVSGRVIDSEGKPVPDIEVEAVAKDNLDSPYFKPRALTDENGTFTLGPMREGKYWIQPDTMKGVNIARSPEQEKTEVKVVDGKVASVGDLLFRVGGPNM